MLKLHLLYLICALIVNGTIGRTEKNTTINIGNVDGPPVTRSQVILTANKFARVHWIMSKINQVGTKFDEAFRSPYPLGERIGMAYKWSGWDTVEDFLEKIEQGYGAGTGGGSNIYKNFSINTVTGTSCTGLVSRAWHLNHKYTLNYASPLIPRKFQEITQVIPGINFAQHKVSGLKKGDAFINATHIILFVYETRDGNPQIIDSSGPGVRFRQITWKYLSRNGYKAIRYNNIKEISNPEGTITKPIIINCETLPYTHSGNTRDVVSMEFDSYSKVPKLNQQGPEIIYMLQLNSEENVTINVTDIKHEGIDNDIHILTTLNKDEKFMAQNCIERADNKISMTLAAGRYYIVVDSGKDLPGEYTLTVDLVNKEKP